MAQELFPCMPISLKISEAVNILARAFESVKGIYSLKDAIRWADNFSFPREAIHSDSSKFKEFGYNLPEFIRWKRSKIPHSRMTVERLYERWDQTDPDFDLLVEIARDGVKVMREQNFVPKRLAPDRFSPNYQYAYTAVNKLIYESYLSYLAIIIPTADFEQVSLKTPIHQSRLGLTLIKRETSRENDV